MRSDRESESAVVLLLSNRIFELSIFTDRIYSNELSFFPICFKTAKLKTVCLVKNA